MQPRVRPAQVCLAHSLLAGAWEAVVSISISISLPQGQPSSRSPLPDKGKHEPKPGISWVICVQQRQATRQCPCGTGLTAPS